MSSVMFLVGRIMALNKIPHSNLKDCDCITLYDKRDFENVINITNKLALKWEIIMDYLAWQR
jgi:hypothetical protein